MTQVQLSADQVFLTLMTQKQILLVELTQHQGMKFGFGILKLVKLSQKLANRQSEKLKFFHLLEYADTKVNQLLTGLRQAILVILMQMVCFVFEEESKRKYVFTML